MGPDDEGYDVADPRDPAAEAQRQDEAREALQRAMSGRHDEARAAIALRYEQGMDVSEVAKAMEVPVGTVKTWLFRARERLRAMLAPEWEVERGTAGKSGCVSARLSTARPVASCAAASSRTARTAPSAARNGARSSASS